MDKWVNTYLAIAVTTSCNYNCFYCKPGGESFSIKKETIVFEKLKKVIINAIIGYAIIISIDLIIKFIEALI